MSKVTDELKQASTDAVTHAIALFLEQVKASGLKPSHDVVLSEARHHADTLFIAATGGRKGGGGFKKKGTPTEYKCPACGTGEIWDMRADKSNPKAPDFSCQSCKNDKGYKTGFWLTDNRTGTTKTPEELFGVHDFSNAGLEAAATPPTDDLPFAIPSYFQNWWEEEDGDI